jgi:sn-glycerol 3-phosphate transport system ATP-binding protein
LSSIVVENVSKAFGAAQALKSVSFTLNEGKLLVLLGPSGCGKSTTLRIIAGLEEPTGGRVEIAGRDVTHLPPSERRISMVFQSYALFPHLNVAENIVFGLKVRNVGRAERDERLKRVAELVELGRYLDRKPSQLSGGQRQRVALARAVIAEQPVCLMDEPLSNLDAQLRHEMRVEIRALQQRLGMTMVYVTHDQTEAMTMADQIILMRDGAIEQAGPPDALYNEPATAFVARFIGAPPMNLVRDGERLVGIRPEHVHLSSKPAPGESGRPGTVSSTEYLGADTIVTVETEAGDRIAVRHPGVASAKPGDRVLAAWGRKDERAFDARSEKYLEPVASSPRNKRTAIG